MNLFVSPPVNIVTTESLQQTNGYDCGVFLLKNAENVITHYKESRSFENLPNLVMTEVSTFREDLKQLILTLKS